MLDDVFWDRLRPHEEQSRLWRCPSRRVVVAAGRGSGKTTIARRRVAAFSLVRKQWHDPRYFYALPTYKQAKLVAWPYMKGLVPDKYLADEPNDSSMTIKTVFGSEIALVGLDKPQRLEGVQWDGGVVDEAADQKPGWFKSLRPALSHRKGWLWLIGVPKRHGHGAKEFRRRFASKQWESFHWTSDTVLPPEEIADAMADMTSKDFNEQYRASFESAGGAAFYAFDAEYNVRNVPYDHTRRVIVSCDFNVNPMAWVCAHEDGDNLEVFDEIYLYDTNTRASLDVLWKRYGGRHRGGWMFTGDAASRNRHTSASKSDYKQIKDDTRFKAVVKFPRSNPVVKDRLASCNTMLHAADGKVRVHIDPRCANLIDDFRDRALKDDGNPDDGAGIGHISDAFGYLVWYKRPFSSKTSAKTGVGISG